MITCTKLLRFSSGHRVMGHEGKCRFLHGHNYTAEVTCVGDTDSLGRVIDFGEIKEHLGLWLDENWDHGLILNQHDEELKRIIQALNVDGVPQKVYFLPYNPTAENMAKYILELVWPGLFFRAPIKLTSVKIWETENCYASAICD